MKTGHFSLRILAALALTSSALAADAVAPSADSIIRATSSKLASAQRFTFRATREIDATLLEGRDLPEKANVTVAVMRPDKLSARATSREGVRRFIADGRRLTVADETAGFYAQVPMRATLDQLVSALDEVYGFTPPLAEFALSNVYQDLKRQAHTFTYLGKERVSAGFLGLGSVECHRIGLSGKAADAELWIATGDQLPRRLVATFKRAGKPQVQVNFSSWNLAAPLGEADFSFAPPSRASKVEMWSKAQMQAARKQ